MSSTAAISVTRHVNTRTGIFLDFHFNSGFITSRLGLIKLLILLLSLMCFILILVETQKAQCGRGARRNSEAACYKIYTGDLFLLLINFCHLHVIVLMLITCLFSITNESLLPKTTFDYVFHHVAFGLYLIGGLWVFIDSVSDGRSAAIIWASIFSLLCAVAHLIHGFFSFNKSTLL